MKKIFDNFNNRITASKALGVLETEGENKMNAAIAPKENGQELQEVIITAIEESKCAENCKLLSAEMYDYDFAIEIKAAFDIDGDTQEETFHLTFTSLY